MNSSSFRRLWILEDESDLRSILLYLANSRGYQARDFSSLAEAWTALLESIEKPADLSPHFIISDFNLMDGDSEEWMSCVRGLFPMARLVCLSSFVDQKVVLRLIEQGILYCQKPATLVGIFELLEERKAQG